MITAGNIGTSSACNFFKYFKICLGVSWYKLLTRALLISVPESFDTKLTKIYAILVLLVGRLGESDDCSCNDTRQIHGGFEGSSVTRLSLWFGVYLYFKRGSLIYRASFPPRTPVTVPALSINQSTDVALNYRNTLYCLRSHLPRLLVSFALNQLRGKDKM